MLRILSKYLILGARGEQGLESVRRSDTATYPGIAAGGAAERRGAGRTL